MLMERLNNGLKLLADEMGKGAAQDAGRVAGCLKDLQSLATSDEARGYAGTEQLAIKFADLKRGQDELVERTRKLERLGISNGRDTGATRMTRREARRLLAEGRVFRSDEHAAMFAALACRQLAPAMRGMVAERTLGYAEELAKAGHSLAFTKTLDPGVAGSGLEFITQNVYMADLITALEAVWVLPPFCTRVPLTTLGTTTWPKLSGELTAYAVAASAAIPESEPSTTSVTLTPVKFGISFNVVHYNQAGALVHVESNFAAGRLARGGARTIERPGRWAKEAKAHAVTRTAHEGASPDRAPSMRAQRGPSWGRPHRRSRSLRIPGNE
jgi:hypothetical protein